MLKDGFNNYHLNETQKPNGQFHEGNMSSLGKCLGPWLFLFLLKESQERHSRYLHNLESDSRNISHGVPLSTKSCNQDFVLQQLHHSH